MYYASLLIARCRKAWLEYITILVFAVCRATCQFTCQFKSEHGPADGACLRFSLVIRSIESRSAFCAGVFANCKGSVEAGGCSSELTGAADGNALLARMHSCFSVWMSYLLIRLLLVGSSQIEGWLHFRNLYKQQDLVWACYFKRTYRSHREHDVDAGVHSDPRRYQRPVIAPRACVGSQLAAGRRYTRSLAFVRLCTHEGASEPDQDDR